MKPYYEDDAITLWHGDCLDVLATLPNQSVDSVVTDPPYGIAFMGKAWDQPGQFGSKSRGAGGLNKNSGDKDAALEAGRYDLSPHAMRNFQLWCESWATECYRVLRPGGHLLAFGGSRTWHRLAAGVEDAGFEIRDSIAWLFASGFPKSLNVSKAITGTQLGYGGNSAAIRRAAMGEDYEPSGVCGNRDGVTRRSDTGMADRDLAPTPDAERWQGWGTALKPAFEPIVVARKPLKGTVASNVIEYGTGAINIDACRVPMTDADADAINAKHAGMDVDSYERRPGDSLHLSTNPIPLKAASAHDAGRWPANVILDEHQAAELDDQSGVSRSRSAAPRAASPGNGWRLKSTGCEHDDIGGASRFFYTAKADSSERVNVGGIAHPTVKPLDIMRWLVRLVTPPGGIVLEPFAGSGTTVEACLLEGFQCIAIERESDYLPLVRQRIDRRLDPVAAIRNHGGDRGLFELLAEGDPA